jgi:glycosyltransferase involved in cell wall biosynthesis
MKILVVDEMCYPQLGGIQVRFKDLAEHWVGMGHQVHVTAIDHIGTSAEEEKINGVIYHRIIKDPNYYKSGPFGRNVSTIINYTFKLRPYLRQEWDLIIFCQFPMFPELFYKYFYKKRAKTVLDFVEHRGSGLWKKINNNIINAADKVVCVSEHVRRCAYAYRKDNMYVMPSFVETGNSKSVSKSNYIFLGRMEEHKHPELAIEAVIEYNKTYNKTVHLNMVGSGSMLETLKNQYQTVPFITFWGSVDETTKGEILANGRLLILPSEREGLPIVVIEAMAYGVPTITTDFPGNGTQFFVNDELIGKVALPTSTDIANKIHEIENNYNQFVDRCNEIKGNYDVNLISKKYLEIFN